jgi:hypothetical protein
VNEPEVFFDLSAVVAAALEADEFSLIVMVSMSPILAALISA